MKNKNLVWPLGITFVMVLFTGMTLLFVRTAFSQRVDLVASDYYYRDKMFSDRLTREKKLLSRGTTEIRRNANGIAVQLPEFFRGKAISGTVQFYSPLNPADDFTLPLGFSGNTANLVVPAATAQRWRVSLDFISANEGYYFEKLLP